MKKKRTKTKDFPVRVKVLRVEKKPCAFGHKKGDTWILKDGRTVAGICGAAYDVIFPYYRVLRFGGEFPWEKNKDKAVICCPDPKSCVVFELTRLKK
jgi:uncharacterized repeat protein (TIGR04076 family)